MEVAEDLESIRQAEEYKNKGNEFFKKVNYDQAIDEYTKAIALKLNSPKSAVYYANRAFAHMKLENYGLAIADCEDAIKLDPNYAKAYYRKADANIALNKYEIARDCLKKVLLHLKVQDSDAQEKYKFVQKVIKERAFSEAIKKDDDFVKIEYKDIFVEQTYDGPKFEDTSNINSEWVIQFMEYQKNQKKLHKKFVIQILLKVLDILTALPSLVDEEIPSEKEITVCGDTHGQYYDLLNIFKMNGNPSEENPYLFNGDFVDRGSFSVEVILTLLTWKVANPKCMHLTRGNHEAKNMNKLYGFEGEVLHKYDNKIYELFSQVFCALPLGFVLNKKVMIVHGGLFSQDNVKLDDLRKIDRFREPPDSGLMTDMLWADPAKENGRQPSKRGISIGFGPDIAKKFLDDNSLELLVRSHEMKNDGFEIEADGKVITIFSAPNYCDQMKNKGAYIRFKGKDMKPKITAFDWVEHPNIPVMAYSRNYLPFM